MTRCLGVLLTHLVYYNSADAIIAGSHASYFDLQMLPVAG